MNGMQEEEKEDNHDNQKDTEVEALEKEYMEPRNKDQ